MKPPGQLAALIVLEPPGETANCRPRPLATVVTIELKPVQPASAATPETVQATAGLVMPGTTAEITGPKVVFFIASVAWMKSAPP